MKLLLEINNLERSPVKKNVIRKIILETLKQSGYIFLFSRNLSMSVALVSREEIRALNKKYRGQNKATDILSFPEYPAARELKKETCKDIFLGELIICYDDIVSYAKQYHKKLEKEFAAVVAHGVLHLLGMEHSKRMFQLQSKVSS